jgi:hypothetical protein
MMGFRVLRRSFWTVSVHVVIDSMTAECRRFQASITSLNAQKQYSDFSKESPLLEPDVINNIGIESPYSMNKHNKRHISIVNGTTNNTLG